MSFPADQMTELKALAPGLKQAEEGGCAYFLLPALALPEGCNPERSDALLCPCGRDGYPSRLFFAERIRSKTDRNWNANGVRILERNWHAFSWRVNRPDLRLVQLVAAHVEALR